MKRDGLQQIAIAGLLATLAVLIPWVVLYTVVLGSCGRWSARQWGIA